MPMKTRHHQYLHRCKPGSILSRRREMKKDSGTNKAAAGNSVKSASCQERPLGIKEFTTREFDRWFELVEKETLQVKVSERSSDER
ncbi:hypothetical protein VZT92_015789 [Zoarces viviparus]|uniref:Uncharacterized protein n=1 Tax=Zoarces viviparus TaxID=48416 RepID=A0AAW1EXY7_ZOAVI